jgi:hypothetical protein
MDNNRGNQSTYYQELSAQIKAPLKLDEKYKFYYMASKYVKFQNLGPIILLLSIP